MCGLLLAAQRSRSTTGNSFATPHIAGLVAKILGKHSTLTPFQDGKVILRSVAPRTWVVLLHARDSGRARVKIVRWSPGSLGPARET